MIQVELQGPALQYFENIAQDRQMILSVERGMMGGNDNGRFMFPKEHVYASECLCSPKNDFSISPSANDSRFTEVSHL